MTLPAAEYSPSAAFLLPAMKFVQFADVHLDSRIASALSLPEEKRSALRRDIRTAFLSACELATREKADLVLIPGDLFDYETADSDTTQLILEALKCTSPARVFITPGNHDSLNPRSPYFDSHMPANVHVFTSPEFESVLIEELECSVTGIAHIHRGITDRLLSHRIDRPQCAVNIALFHGSRDGYKPSEKETVIPFSDDDIIRQGFTYCAIGHYHSFGVIEDDAGRNLAAYSGCVQGRGMDETGEKGVLIGEIDAGGHVTLEKAEVAPRRIVAVEVDITGSQANSTVIERIEAAVHPAARECDIVNVSLTGALSPTLNPDTSAWETSAPYFHVNINRSRVEPDYDLESISMDSAASSLRAAFVQRLLEMERESDDPQEQRTVRDAIYYGLYALDGRKLEPRDES